MYAISLLIFSLILITVSAIPFIVYAKLTNKSALKQKTMKLALYTMITSAALTFVLLIVGTVLELSD
jgi:hypothetical protein